MLAAVLRFVGPMTSAPKAAMPRRSAAQGSHRRSRMIIAAIVVALHVIVGRLIATDRPAYGARAQSTVLVATLIHSAQSVPPEPDVPPPPSEPIKSDGESPAIEGTPAPIAAMAIPIPAPGEARPSATIVIEEAGFDTQALSLRCETAYPNTSADLSLPGSTTMLVRVEHDGRPSETKIILSSGSDTFDQAATACILSLGLFEPGDDAMGRVATWRKLVWSNEAKR